MKAAESRLQGNKDMVVLLHKRRAFIAYGARQTHKLLRGQPL